MKKILSFVLVMLLSFMFLENVNVINEVNSMEMSADMVSNASYNTTNYYYNDSTLYQNDKYSSYYFNNLTNNFGNNIKGSCTYIAFAMLLSYYDTYWDDNIIPENYDMISLLSTNELELNVESPGIYTENSSLVWNSMSTANYYQVIEQYSNAHLHLKLIQMGKEKFGQYKFDDPDSPCALYHYQLIDLMDYYLYDYMNFDETKINYTSTSSNVRQFVINNIKAGKPVLVRMGSTTISEIGHAFILYDYDETNDELYGHWGWKLGGYKFEHIKLSTTPYNDFWDATVLNVNVDHNCSNNYKYSNEYDFLETFCPCAHSIHEEYVTPHTHSYTMQYYNYKWHKLTCECGQTTGSTQVHTILQSEIINGRYAECLGCHHLLDLNSDMALVGGINSDSVTQVSINGSYILPSGIVVLVDEDLDAYLNGTLVFYDKDKVPVIQ